MSNRQGDQATDPRRGPAPRNDLNELKNRLNRAQQVVVDAKGNLHIPEDPTIAAQSPHEKTLVRPQRWFGEAEPWYELNPARLLLEKKAMEARFPGFLLVRVEKTNRLAWRGTLQTNRGNSYEIALVYPDDFPAHPPKAYPITPPIEVWKDAEQRWLKHQYRDGEFCLYYPQDRDFTPNTTAAKVMAIAATWLFSYESWLESGKTDWPGIEID